MSFNGFQWLLRGAACIGVMAAAALPAQAVLSVGEVQFHLLGRYETGIFKESAAEIIAHDPGTQRLFVTNAAAGTVDVLNISNPSSPTLITSIDLSPFGSGANSVAIHNGIVAVAVEAVNKQANGQAVFFNAANLSVLGNFTVGALPDMLTFTPDGTRVLVANEGEPNSYNQGDSVDPVGSVSIIDISGGIAAATVTTVGFEAFNVGGPRHAELPADVRIFGPNATVAQDLEPEYITISGDGNKAYVALQENNAFAIIDIPTGTIDKIVALGKKDHSLPGNGLDLSDRDGPGNNPLLNIINAPIFGLYMPDGIASYEVNGKTFIVSANEGDARDYDGFSEESRINGIAASSLIPELRFLKDSNDTNRLTVTTAGVPTNELGEFTEIHAFGARSFSIWDDQGVLVWDSGDQFEQILADLLPDHFNSNHDEGPSFDTRSDNKGPEPEGVTIGILNDRIFAFIGLERFGGIMVYDVTDPNSPFFAGYANSRVFGPEYNDEELFPNAALLSSLGDLGPEGLIFITAADSPNGRPLIVLASEVSGTTSIFQVGVVPEPATGMLAMLGLGALMLRRSRA